jgi:membrane fusion protein, multidrug efflux system
MADSTETKQPDAMTKDKSKPNGKDENNKSNSKSLLKQKKFWIPFFIILIAGIFAWKWYEGQLGYVSTDDAFVDGNKLSLSSKVLGRITNLYTDEGDKVTKGELLVRLDSTDLIAQRDQAMNYLKLSQDNIQLAQVKLDKAQTDYDRAKQQLENKIIPKEQFDHAKSDLETAQAELNIARTKIGSSKAQLNLINTELQNTKIYTSMDGVVAKKWLLEGDVVQPGQPIFAIYNLDSLWVTADLQETDLASIKIGEEVEIDVDSYPDNIFKGEVIQIGSNTASQFALIPPSNAAGNFTKITQRIPVKISVEHIESKNQNSNNDPKLLPGMSVEVKIKVAK